MDFGTHSNDSVPCPKTMRSTVMLACRMDRSASGWQDSGKDPVWNVPGNENPVPPMGKYSCCTFQMHPDMKDHPSIKNPLSHLSLERH